MLIFNQRGELLIIKPTYRNTWSWPGGGWEAGETPHDTAIRECTEEIGLCPGSLKPAFINYVPPRSDSTKDVLHFVYTIDSVDNDLIHQLTLQQDEIEVVKFIPTTELGTYMKPYRVTAVDTYLTHRTIGALLYLEDGELVQ